MVQVISTWSNQVEVSGTRIHWGFITMTGCLMLREFLPA